MRERAIKIMDDDEDTDNAISTKTNDIRVQIVKTIDNRSEFDGNSVAAGRVVSSTSVNSANRSGRR